MWPFWSDARRAEYKRQQEERYKEEIADGSVRIDEDGSAWQIYVKKSDQMMREAGNTKAARLREEYADDIKYGILKVDDNGISMRSAGGLTVANVREIVREEIQKVMK